MKYAIISDIHGNLPALNAIIEDAESNHVDSFIFVGDYCLSNPFPDECITRIKNMPSKYVIRGNEEAYIENLVGKDQSTWTDGQMQISYWCYQNISPENRDYLLSLPAQLEFTCNGVALHVSHSSADFIGDSEHRGWRTSKVAERYQDRFISHTTLREDVHSYLYDDKCFNVRMETLAEGIYIFGHSHIQWSYQSDDGKKILINPGSCGLPLDCIENGMPYTILNVSNKENVNVEERRVAFDKDKYIQTLQQSDQFVKASVWSQIIVRELKTCREHLSFFLKFAEEYARRIGDTQRPFSVSTWEKAFELFQIAENSN